MHGVSGAPILRKYGPRARVVEQLTVNQKVVGSNPTGAAIWAGSDNG